MSGGRWPVSMKGVVLLDDRPEECVVRVVEEELELTVTADELVDVWV